MKHMAMAGLMILVYALPAVAQDAQACRIFCGPEFKVEPTVTIGNLFRQERIIAADGSVTRPGRSHEFELILSMELPTRISWLEFTVEASFLPFDRDSTPELEFETNLTWLPSDRTAGWLSSHFDIIDQYSPAERPEDTRAYTHKLNLEWDTSLAIFNRLPRGRWLRDVELEASLDYVATGLPKGTSPWSLSLVVALPVAPF